MSQSQGKMFKDMLIIHSLSVEAIVIKGCLCNSRWLLQLLWNREISLTVLIITCHEPARCRASLLLSWKLQSWRRSSESCQLWTLGLVHPPAACSVSAAGQCPGQIRTMRITSVYLPATSHICHCRMFHGMLLSAAQLLTWYEQCVYNICIFVNANR